MLFLIINYCLIKYKAKENKSNVVILLPLHPVSLMHKNSLRCKIIHGIRSVGRKDRSTDLKMCLEYPVRVISVAVITAVV